MVIACACFFFSSRRRHTRWNCDWSSDVCSSDLLLVRDRANSWHAPPAGPRGRVFGRAAVARAVARARRRPAARDRLARRWLSARASGLPPARAAGLPRRHDRRLRGMSELWLDVAGARMRAHVAGDGPPVVLLHGYGVSGTYMLPLAHELADSYRVLVPELPGQGKSEPRPGLR